MATIAELNIRLGLLTKEFDRELKGVERKMKQAGQQLSSLGSDLTAAVSLPLVGLGFAAIKSAGDIEALRLALTTTMTDAGASTADVTAELEALRVAALAPGLDFEQAIKASVRLQNVGFSAEEARQAIIGMAKAVALSGGTADDLNEVTNQFSQMIGKGKVFQDDLKIITGRMPKLAAIMKETFGVTTAEGINALGISSKEFVSTVVGEMNKLPQVSSGIKNSLVNLFVGLKLEAARVGDEINKAFNIEGVGDGILSVVRFIVDGFASLTDGSKKVVIGMAAIAAAAGPVVFVFGKIIAFLAPIRTGFLAASQAVAVLNAQMAATSAVQATLQSGARAYAATVGTTTVATQGLTTAFAASTAAAENSRRAGRLMAETLKKTGDVSVGAAGSFTGLSAVLQRATVAFQALNLAQKALLVGGIIAAIAAVVVVYNELTREVSAAAKAQRAISDVSLDASKSIAGQKAEVERLTAVIQNENANLRQKEDALKRLKEISPAYYGSLVIAKGRVEGLTDATKAYVSSLLQAAKAQAAQDKITELARKNLDLEDEMLKTSSLYDRFIVGPFVRGEKAIVKARNERLKNEIAANEKSIESLGSLIEATELASQTDKAPIEPPKPPDPNAIAAAKKQIELYQDALASIAAVAQKGDVLGADIMSEQAREIESQIERLLENGFKPYSKQIEHLRGMLKQLREDAGKGFETPNTTQQELGFSLDIPNIPSLQIPEQVVSIDTSEATDKVEAFTDLQAAATKQISDLRRQAHEEELARIEDENAARQLVVDTAIETAKTIADSIISIQQSKSKEEIRILEQEYATRIEAAQGNSQQVAALQEELAARKEAIEKKTAKKAQGVAIGQAIVNTAQGVTKALASAPPPFNFALAALVAAAGIAEITKIKAQAFAKGGVIDRPTLAIVGEYAGASNNPEIITPEKKLTNVFTDVLNSFDFQFPEPTEQKAIKQEPPVVNIQLGEVTPNNSISNTVEQIIAGFKMPEVNIFQDGETAPTDQPVPGINSVLKSISQSIVIPEMPRIQAPTAEITNRDVFTSINPTFTAPGGEETLTAVVRGDDLLFLVDKAAVRRGRTK